MSETLFTEKQIQGVICMLCKATRGHNTCILSDFDRSQIDDNELYCTFTTDEFGNFDKNSEEVLAVCKWLYTDDIFSDNEDFFVRHENYYSRIRK